MFTFRDKTSTMQPVMSPNVPRISWQNICTNCHLSAKNFSKEIPRNRRRSCEIHDLEWKTSTMYIISDGWLICILEGVSIWIWICFLLLSNMETFHNVLVLQCGTRDGSGQFFTPRVGFRVFQFCSNWVSGFCIFPRVKKFWHRFTSGQRFF